MEFKECRDKRKQTQEFILVQPPTPCDLHPVLKIIHLRFFTILQALTRCLKNLYNLECSLHLGILHPCARASNKKRDPPPSLTIEIIRSRVGVYSLKE